MADSTSTSDASSGGNLPAVPDRFEDKQLRDIGSFADAMNLLADQGFTVENYAEAYGTGFAICEDKNKLCGEHLIILEWKFNKGSFGEFVSCAVVTASGQKWIVNDGSTGMCQQLNAVTLDRLSAGMDEARALRGLELPRGLRVSQYPTHQDGTPLTKEEIADGVPSAGSGETFYLNN